MKLNVNDLSQLADLKKRLTEGKVSAAAINNIEKALKNGLTFKKLSDFDILGVSVTDVKVIGETITFGNPVTTNTVKTVQYTFKPVGDEKLFLGYQFIISYINKQRFTITESFPIEDNRIVLIDIDPAVIADGSKISYQVKSAMGEYAAISLGNTEPRGEIIEVEKNAIGNIILNVATISFDIGKPADMTMSYQVRGKLIITDEQKADGYQIVLSAALKNGENEAPVFFPVGFATTETNGYFVTGLLVFNELKDAEKVIAAKVTVSKDDRFWEQPVTLKEKTEDGAGTTYSIPQRLIVVVNENEDGGKEDCKCGCGDLNFHNKKVLEERSYYAVVRTTEPSIIADVIEDEEEVDLDEIYGSGGKVPLSIFRKYVASVDTLVKNSTEQKDEVSNSGTDYIVGKTTSKTVRVLSLNRDLLAKIILDHKVAGTTKGKNKRQFKGRTYLSPLNQIDWDDEPTIYQAASIAHGHLLHFKQEWLPDGYSLGDILYSLPLAPGQKKQIAVLDWERRESASNTQELDYEEALNSTLIRDRDISEVVNATLNENIRANSNASTGGFGFGFGSSVMGIIPGIGTFGSLLGISGGKSSSGSSASQNAHRDSTASSLQSISDRTSQAASMVRSQRATVVQTVSQGERVQATAESVANYNHCHAITIQYFEVLRHFSVQTRLAGVQECLFIPLQITPFDLEKCLRWRSILERRLLKRTLLPAFDAIVRILHEKENADNYYDSIGYPRVNYAEQNITTYSGDLFIEFSFFNNNDNRIDDAIMNFFTFLNVSLSDYKDRYLRNDELADIVGPRAIECFLNAVRIWTDKGRDLNFDLSLVSVFRQRATLRVSIRQDVTTPRNVPRSSIEALVITIDKERLKRSDPGIDFSNFGNKYMKVRVLSGNLRYRTENFSGFLFNQRIENDLFADTDGVYIPTPLTQDELRNPRAEDVNFANKLLHHLNESLEYYHKAIWFDMTPERRYMLLDGIIAPGKANGRSVASVVENRLIGIAGNSLIMPVAPGNQLDPTIDITFDLFAQYYNEQQDPMRVSLPTKGVYAESVMGKCNSCEEKDESRFWRWEESPIPDSPTTPILPINTDTRRADPGNLQAKDFPQPVVNIQNAPAAPDPTGLQNILELMGKSDAFRDLTGLSQNQLNALATFQKTMDTAQSFGKEAAELAKAAAKLDMIKDANKSGILPTADAQEEAKKALDTTKADQESKEQEREETQKDTDQINEAKQKGQIDEGQSKEMTEDRIRKGQGTTKTPSKPKGGKNKYNLILNMKNMNGGPLVGSFLLNYGAVVDDIVEISSSSIFRTTIELDSSKDNILEIKGTPGEAGASSADPDFYYHFATAGITIGNSTNLSFDVLQTRQKREITTSSEHTTAQVVERAVEKEVSMLSGFNITDGTLLSNIRSIISATLAAENATSASSSSSTSTSQSVTYSYFIPSRRLKIVQKGVNYIDVNIDED